MPSKLSWVFTLFALSLTLNVASLSAAGSELLALTKSNVPSPPTGDQQQKREKPTDYSQNNPLPPWKSITTNPPQLIANQEKTEQHSQELYYEWFWPPIWSGWAQVLVAAIGLFIIWRTLKAVEQQAESSSVSANAANASTNIAKLSMIASSRAYVHYDGCRWISHSDLKDNHIFWRLSSIWVNRGNTPTRNLRISLNFELRSDDLPQDYEFAQDRAINLSPVTIPPGGNIKSGGWDIRGEDLVAIREGRKHLYIWGNAMYRDVFPGTEEHVTKFCVFATNITGDPMRAWDAIQNPFDIMFAVYRRHNCTDEDCDQKSLMQ